MIAALIRWSARNTVLVGLGTIFVTLAGIYAVSRVPLDAIPDLSDVQVIVYTEYPGQAPQVVEDQVTYPLTTAMLSVPKSRVVRGFSFFGVSFVYVIFEDGTDLYWARSRVLEYLSSAARRLPAGVAPSLGPDATGVGWAEPSHRRRGRRRAPRCPGGRSEPGGRIRPRREGPGDPPGLPDGLHDLRDVVRGTRRRRPAGEPGDGRGLPGSRGQPPREVLNRRPPRRRDPLRPQAGRLSRAD
jgi:hypothetical protein